MAEMTTNHATIQRWAVKHGGKPASVQSTHEGVDVGIVRIMFPDAPQSEHENLVEIPWEEFFEEFDSRGLALLYEEDSMFNKLVDRKAAVKGGKPTTERKGRRKLTSGRKSRRAKR
jgi:hypothetical protein